MNDEEIDGTNSAPAPANATPFVGKLQGQGKVTVPKNVRDLHGLRDGDYVECVFVRKLGGGPSP